MKKNKFRAILNFMLFVACMLLLSFPVQAATRSIRSASDFHKISSYNGGTFKLQKDIKLTSVKQYLTISKDKKYTIDLNGHRILATSYNSGKVRDYTPIHLKKGTLLLKNSASKTASLISTECSAVDISGGKLYLYSKVNITCNNVGFIRQNGEVIMNGACGIFINGGRLYAKGGNITGICHGINLYKGRLYTYGAGTKTYPCITGKYGNGLYIYGKNCAVSLKGGSFITKTGTYSGYYPILDYHGTALKISDSYGFYRYNRTPATIQRIYFTNVKYVEGLYDSSKKWKYIAIFKK